MPSLLDIAPPEATKREVEIYGGQTVTIRGVTAEVWANLYRRYPLLAQFVQGQIPAKMEAADAMNTQAALAALIAAAAGSPDNPEAERRAHTWFTIGEQLKIVEQIVEISMPGEVFGPLVNGHDERVPVVVEPEPSGEATATKS